MLRSLLPIAGASSAGAAPAAATAPAYNGATPPAFGVTFDHALRTAVDTDAPPKVAARPRPKAPANDRPSAVEGRRARQTQESPRRPDKTTDHAQAAPTDDEQDDDPPTAQGVAPAVPAEQPHATVPGAAVPGQSLTAGLEGATGNEPFSPSAESAAGGGGVALAAQANGAPATGTGGIAEDAEARRNTSPGTDRVPGSDLSARPDARTKGLPQTTPSIDATGGGEEETFQSRRVLDGASSVPDADLSGTVGPSLTAATRQVQNATAAATTEANLAPVSDVDTKSEQAQAASPTTSREASPQQPGGEDARSGRESDGSPARGGSSFSHSLTLVASPDGTLRLAPTTFTVPTLAPMRPEHDAVNVNRMVQTMKVMVKDSVSEATVHLHPEHFGDVRLQIRVDGTSVSTIVHAESADVREWLQGQEASLRDSLRDQGLQLDKLVVERDGRHDRRDAPQQQAERRRVRMRPHTEGEPRFDVSV